MLELVVPIDDVVDRSNQCCCCLLFRLMLLLIIVPIDVVVVDCSG